MDELSLLIAEEPLADELSTAVEEEDINQDDLPDAGDDGAPTDDGFVWDGTIDDGTIDDGTVDDGTIDDGTIDDGTIDDGTIDGVTIDEGTAGDGGVIEDGSAGEDDLIGDDASDEDWLVDDGSWSYVELHASEDDVAWDADVATDPFIRITVNPDELSLGYEQLGRPMFEDKGPADSTDTSTDGLIEPAICLWFPCDAIA